MIGRQLDRYRLLEEIGSGGMAVVYKAHDAALERDVAVKVMHPHLAGREESRRRFSREARAVARLRHPNIVEIFDFSGDDAAESFIVTEYVKGRTLLAFAQEIGIGLPEVGALLAERLAEALEHAHAAGVIHRDLKPENVMVGDDGELKLMDFGIARMIGKDERMTMTGALVGSPLHMAPEVIEGGEIGVAADLFSLGTILYWMVTGRMAFEGNNTTQTLRRILEADYPDPRLAAPACSDELAEVIATCLRREPDTRYASMGALRAALLEVLAASGLSAGDAELRAFFGDPQGFREALRLRLLAKLLAEGHAAMAARRPARAVAVLDRVLALDPGNERAKALLERMGRGRMLRRRLAKGAIVLGSAVLVAGGGFGLWSWMNRPEAPSGVAPPSEDPPRDRPSESPGSLPRERTSAEADPTAPRPEASAGPTSPATPDRPASDRPVSDRPVSDRGARAEPGEGAPAGLDREAKASPETAPGRNRDSARAAAPEANERPTRSKRMVQLRWVPQGATLSIDGAAVDTVAPSWSGELSAGHHTLSLTHSGCCEAWEETLEIAEGAEPVQRSIVLAPLESGWFTIDSDLPDAEVWLDGTYKGTVADVNRRGGVAVAFSRNDAGQERYVKSIRFELFPPSGSGIAGSLRGEATVRAGEHARSAPLRFALPPAGGDR
ncbi:serine/threonine-protein kinase [Vulgatibacter incomptus]|uniref:Serine/threonine protein kinase n=1 Tax=Vulgatibacter incomptus TaxID=1391653 RepID=A0A0K1PA39_9BACT|nr:serine/threonine-protein kinase [Vulgatibacter incomptus]AKU90403.1 serine/threonine protein kinase [Vulgatibacter incomptus]